MSRSYSLLSTIITSMLIALGMAGCCDLCKVLNQDLPITTSVSDSTGEAPELDGYEPKDPALLTEMPRTSEGGFYLLPGDYEYTAQTYCLRPGTYAPKVDGPGYINAELKGSASGMVRTALERSVAHPDIEQQQIQLLLWAITARVELTNMDPEVQRAASVLLTPLQLAQLSSNAIGAVSQPLLDKALQSVPSAARQAVEAQAVVRNALAQAGSTYADIEHAAVLIGDAPAQSQVRNIPWGRWSRDPNGFFVRYLPSDYTSTVVQLHVPSDTPAARYASGRLVLAAMKATRFSGAPAISTVTGLKQYNPAAGVAVPANSEMQRLGVSGRPDKSQETSIDKARKITKYIRVPLIGAKFPAGTIAFLIPNAILHYIIVTDYDAAGGINAKLSGDPPRQDYTLFAKPEIPLAPQLTSGDGVSAADAAAVNDLVATTVSLWAHIWAAQVTLDRLAGAEQAGDQKWSEEQARALIYLKRQVGLLLIEDADLTDKYLSIVSAQGLQDVSVTADDIRSYQQELRQDGFPPEAIKAAKLLGFSDADTSAELEAQLAIDPEKAAGSMLQMVRNSIDGMRAYGAVWSKLPTVTAPWDESR